MTKLILDACCGGRSMWFDKQNPAVEFCDIRQESHVVKDGGKLRTITIAPDTVADFRLLPYPDDSFVLVAFDPPHLLKTGKSYIAARYGVLSETWESDIRQGVNECMRVLKPEGTLVFKWSERDIALHQVLSCIEYEPLFGHTTTKRGTHWMCFVKGISKRRKHVQEVMAL